MELNEFIYSTFLFKEVDKEVLNKILELRPPTIVKHKRNDLVYSSSSANGRVGFVLDGICEICRVKPDGSHVVLNTLEKHGSFGILSALSAEDFPTQVFACKSCSVLYFSSDDLWYFVNNYSQISKNLIEFLASRVLFLNKKIATFSGTRVENRLASFLLLESDRINSNSLDLNLLKTSEEINAGRASVYRAIESFQNDGLIKVENKKIIIIDRTGLERITQ